MLAVHLVTVCLCAAAGRLPRLMRRKVAMLRAFTVGFLESSKSCLLLLVVLPGLIDTLAQLLAWKSLLWLYMTWWRSYLAKSNFLTQHRWPDLWRYIYFVSVGRSLYGGRTHTHTHTHTQTVTISSFIRDWLFLIFLYYFKMAIQFFFISIRVN